MLDSLIFIALFVFGIKWCCSSTNRAASNLTADSWTDLTLYSVT